MVISANIKATNLNIAEENDELRIILLQFIPCYLCSSFFYFLLSIFIYFFTLIPSFLLSPFFQKKTILASTSKLPLSGQEGSNPACTM